MRMKVVLPDPLGPRRPKVSPWRIARSKPSRAEIRPKRLQSACVSIAGIAGILSDRGPKIKGGALTTGPFHGTPGAHGGTPE